MTVESFPNSKSCFQHAEELSLLISPWLGRLILLDTLTTTDNKKIMHRHIFWTEELVYMKFQINYSFSQGSSQINFQLKFHMFQLRLLLHCMEYTYFHVKDEFFPVSRLQHATRVRYIKFLLKTFFLLAQRSAIHVRDLNAPIGRFHCTTLRSYDRELLFRREKLNTIEIIVVIRFIIV